MEEKLKNWTKNVFCGLLCVELEVHWIQLFLQQMRRDVDGDDDDVKCESGRRLIRLIHRGSENKAPPRKGSLYVSCV